MTLADTVAAVRRRERSATENVRASLRAIERHNDTLGAFISVDAEHAMERAGAVDACIAAGENPGALCGVALAVKDNLCTSFGTTTCGSRHLAEFRSPYDATAVERLEAAGAVVVGKTNLDEFAMGSSTENSAYFPARNPWDIERVPGGSSGGSAAAVAAGLAQAALGSDTGGSVRQPASMVGITGLKPTYGRVSRHGLVAFASSLDQIGPMTRTAEDAALLLGVIAGHDPRDATSAADAVPDYRAMLEGDLAGTRIGYAVECFDGGLESAVGDTIEAALDILRENGVEVVEVRLPHLGYAVACYCVVATAEASSNLARFDGVHYGTRTANPRDVDDLIAASRSEGLGLEVKRRIMLGTFGLSAGYHDAYYDKASRVRTLLAGDFAAAFERVDLIAAPVSPYTAFRLGEKSADPLAMYLADVFTTSANLAGIPAMSLPCGFDGDGLPIGLQLMGPHFGEGGLLKVAHRFQSVTGFHLRCAPGFEPSSAED